MPLPMVRLRCAGHVTVLLTLGVATACGGSNNPPTPGPPGTGGGDTITGRERIGWAQQALDATQLATFDYAMYVDGTRRVLTGESCGASGGGFECSAPLPPLTPGQHTLELAAFTTSSGTVFESDRSAALRVTVASIVPPADTAPPVDSTLVTSDGHRLRLSIVARGLHDPSDLAVASDRVFIAERQGRVRILEPQGLVDPPALTLEGVSSAEGTGLTAIALHPDFEQNALVYVAYAADAAGDDARERAVFRVARFRERNGVLAQGAVVARERAASPQHVVARFGPDGLLYLGFASGFDPRDAQSESSVLGKILRLRDDGTLPRDNPRASPVFSSGHRDPRALAWHPGGGMWELERDPQAGDELNAVVAGADYGWPIVRGTSPHPDS